MGFNSGFKGLITLLTRLSVICGFYSLSVFVVILFEYNLFIWYRTSSFSLYTVMHHLTTGIRSEKCFVRHLCHANAIERTYTNLDSVASCMPMPYGIAYLLLGYKLVQHVTVLNTVGNCNTVVSIIIQWNLPKPDPLYTGNLDKRKTNFGTELFPM